MANRKPEPSSDAPFGTEPRRSLWPLVALGVLFLAWLSVVVFLAVRYPAR